MFPLSGNDFPKSSAELAAAIGGALGRVLALAKRDGVVSAEGGKFPTIERLTINLDNAAVSTTTPPSKPKPAGQREPGVTVEHFELSGRPIRYEQSKLELELKASGVKFDLARDKTGEPLLVLAGARDGHVRATMGKADIESLARAAAEAAANTQGIRIEGLDLTLTSEGARSIAADLRVKARKMMVSGIVRITGRVDVDGEMNATISKLDADGEGMIGALASGLLKSKLKPYEGRTFPLMTFSLGDFTLRDVTIDVKSSVQVTAKFGSK